ncbi:MAG: hypothetical protein ACLFV3_09235 [Phycisphaeraceae bacterium]
MIDHLDACIIWLRTLCETRSRRRAAACRRRYLQLARHARAYRRYCRRTGDWPVDAPPWWGR